METRITATDLAKNLSDVLNRIRYRGERFVVERRGEPVASLGPVGAPPGITVGELLRRLGDLALPGDGFAEDLEAIQAAQPKAEFHEWPSENRPRDHRWSSPPLGRPRGLPPRRPTYLRCQKQPA